MTQPNLLNQAKAGNPVAIAMLINRRIIGLGVTAKVTRRQHYLQILLESTDHIPSKKKATRYLRRALTELDPVALTQVKLYGRRADMRTVAWVESIDLVNLAAPTSRIDVAAKAPSTPTGLPGVVDEPSGCDQASHAVEAGEGAAQSELASASEQSTADLSTPQSPVLEPVAVALLWLQWQVTNIKGGIFLLVVLWLITSLIFFVLAQALQAYLGIAMITSLLVGLVISMLIGGLFIGDSQAYFLAQYLPKSGHWRWATFFGFGFGCALASGIHFAGATLGTLALFTLLPLTPLIATIMATVSGAVMGATMSFCQWLVLRHSVKPSYQWIVWSIIAGGISGLIALLGGGTVAGLVAHKLHQLGFISVDVVGGGIIVYGIIASALAWLSYHAISGVGMATILRRLLLVERN